MSQPTKGLIPQLLSLLDSTPKPLLLPARTYYPREIALKLYKDTRPQLDIPTLECRGERGEDYYFLGKLVEFKKNRLKSIYTPNMVEYPGEVAGIANLEDYIKKAFMQMLERLGVDNRTGDVKPNKATTNYFMLRPFYDQFIVPSVRDYFEWKDDVFGPDGVASKTYANEAVDGGFSATARNAGVITDYLTKPDKYVIKLAATVVGEVIQLETDMMEAAFDVAGPKL
ncbi:MAG: hypothetical protein HETSPECPRED_002483 [Heterodermia speciosa]|uniref:Uncharacterized protein n=1 Tax=Heterodermia speciosa TaxID=116794 RepID=A0A8H3J4M4_9LECA|nr:MAG: hypothetical protein HETSPECPRED_002483 [Heterodermia speciosa]